MSADDKEPFLSRWSRRKLKQAEKEAAPKSDLPAVAPSAAATPQSAAPVAPKPELPSVDSLQGLASEYKDFLHPEVDETMRRAALKKLFHDPHFNVMDGLDTYIDDYSKPDPIPEAMLKKLKQANRLLFPEEKPEDPAAEGASPPPAPQATSAPAAPTRTAADAPAAPSGPESKT